MMKFSFQSTIPLIREGAKKHLAYRYPVRRILGPTLGVLCLLMGAFLLINVTSFEYRLIGSVSVFLGLLTIIRWMNYSSKMAKAAFKGREEGRDVHFEATEDGLLVKDENTESTCRWEAFVDFELFEEGVLLYPQATIFYWLPATVDFESGTWEELADLLSRKIKKKT